MSSTTISSPTLAITRLVAYLCLTVALIPVQVLAVAARWRLAVTLPRRYHMLSARLLGLHIETHGRMSSARPTLFVGNHCSYLDITVYGALVEGSFVSKAEVGSWPLFGLLARLQRTVFIDRRRRQAKTHAGELQSRLEAGDNLILFPEGTSSDGNHVLPFKSALFSVAETRVHGSPLTVQPVSVSYARLDGMPIGRYLRPFFAWYGDIRLVPHMWHMLGLGLVTVVATFHEPVTIEQFASRKALSRHCWRVIAEGRAAAVGTSPRGSRRRQPATAAAS